LSIAITRVGPFPPRMSNVGVVIDLAVHDIDLIRWFTDSDIAEVQPQLSNAVAEREDIALLQFRTASGVLAHINTNWLTPFKARNVTIATRNKYIMGDLLTRQVTECFGFQPDGSYSMRHLSVGHAEPLRAELQAFAAAIRDGKEPAVTGEEGVASLEIAIRCLERRATPSLSRRRAGPRRRPGCGPAFPAAIGNLDESAPPPRSRANSVHRRRRATATPRALGRRGDRARARPLPVHPRTRGARARSRARRVLRRAQCRDLCQRHRCVGSGIDGARDWPGRRRDLPELHLHRDRRGGRARWRDAGVRGRGGGELQSRSRKPATGLRHGARAWASAQGRDPGGPLRATRGPRSHCLDRGGGRALRAR